MKPVGRSGPAPRPRSGLVSTGLTAVLVALMTSAALSGCGSRAADASADVAPLLKPPLATSLSTAQGTWATVPMGDLRQPDNTFWQLFFRSPGSTTWSNKVQATATGTNGGLILGRDGRSLLVGVRPFDKLTFSPLLRTADAGRSWTDGVFSDGLADLPDGLAGARGRTVAIAGGARPATVLRSGDFTTWDELVTVRGLQGQRSSRPCLPLEVDAVALLAAKTVVGTACGLPGSSGLFIQDNGGWKATGPRVGPGARYQVVGLLPAGRSLDALLASSSKAGTQLAVASTADGQAWDLSSTLGLGAAQRLGSFGLADGRTFALLDGATGSQALYLSPAPGQAAWERLATPPARTQALAAGPAHRLDALCVDRTVLTVWTAAPDGAGWSKVQTVKVPIQFGSAS